MFVHESGIPVQSDICSGFWDSGFAEFFFRRLENQYKELFKEKNEKDF